MTIQYLTHEPAYHDLYQEVLTFADWVEKYQPEGTRKTDTGIDLVAIDFEGKFTAIQCKNYSPDHRIQKSDIDSFFTASGKKIFSHRVIVTTTDHWSENAAASLNDQQPPVTVIDRSALENSLIDWSSFQPSQEVKIRAKKTLREHQISALNAVKAGLQTANRGKLIMACGTGKTFTSLKIAEEIAGKGKNVLFLVPSLALLSQSLTEWTQEAAIPLHSFAVCSDSDVGKQHKNNDDLVQTQIHELQYPATTNADSLLKAVTIRHNDEAMTVVFSTYHSIDVIHQAQQKGLPPFDLVICDEAHRTTGASFDDDENESAFVRIHNNDYINAHKRLYMTATPRIYTEDAKKTEGVVVYSMDDKNLFGDELYTINFSSAVKRGLLVDYKVLVLAVEESHINRRLEYLLNRENNEIQVDDAAKIVGCWKALSKYGVEDDLADDSQPMKRAVAFCQVIEKDYKGSKHKVSSKAIAEMFDTVVTAYQEQEIEALNEIDPKLSLNQSLTLKCEAEHVDGSMNASEKSSKINWLKADSGEKTCRILSNVRCLSEGVDVPALDAVLFLTARNSQVDVVQSVGRVMRKAEGKKRGYVILPVVIPANKTPEEALNDNENYRVVWQVLNALRSHDDRFDAMLNKMEFDGAAKDKIEVISVISEIFRKQTKKQQANKKKYDKSGRGQHSIGNKSDDFEGEQLDLQFEVGELERALVAKIVKKCGNRTHWEDWAADVAKIAQTHIDRINAVLENPQNTAQREAFNAFANELRDDLNNAISDSDVVEMLAQHLITKPVFDALFANDNFSAHNPMSMALQETIDKLQGQNIANAETKRLQEFYESIQLRVSNIQSPEGKQRIIKELYESFFNNAFPKMQERLGIVYTPIEVVDFILHSVEDVLQQEFNASLADDGVQILDPFTGTGTFITRLLQSGLIPIDKLPNKYQQIHANEIVLLAYYIAAINIESVYHALLAQNEQVDEAIKQGYQPFKGICLTDTFQLYEKEDLVDAILEENSARRKRQKKLDIQVIIGNPPYSAGQTSANDNNANVAYPLLDKRIEDTYDKNSSAKLKTSLYDSYIRAIRWASDRIGKQGVIAFVTNGGFIDSNSADGMRYCLEEEFSRLYIFHLRGNQRTSGEQSRKEGGKIFGSGSRAPIAISILVRNPLAKEQGKIYFHDIGDYLTREQKLEKIAEFNSIKGISQQNAWQEIIPDEFNDWLNQRDVSFDNYPAIGDKKGNEKIVIFSNYSGGVKTNRDIWVYNFSKNKLSLNILSMINFYNEQVMHISQLPENVISGKKIEDLLNMDKTKISWSGDLVAELEKRKTAQYKKENIRLSLYRPYHKQYLYFDRMLNNSVYQIPKIFPTTTAENKVICLSLTGSKEFSLIITNIIPDLHLIGDAQCFPLYLYEEDKKEQGKYHCTDAITDQGLAYFSEYYADFNIQKEDIFYYIYGLLHSGEYRQRYADNLKKQLPRIPRVKNVKDFWQFVQAGRALAELHLHYDQVPMYDGVLFSGGLKIIEDKLTGGGIAFKPEDFYVEKMKFVKKTDKSKVKYNEKFTIENIPLEAFDYIVNGKSALEWVMERQSVKVDKDSALINDTNDWAKETMGNAKYPLELFLRVTTVSLKTMEIVKNLPKLVI
ncbi:DEAD/DEAH box helicase family protein [Gallibacterium anatis]|uniref:DEAD/DEAH box helicase n=1 Tax=Gallibacterium anatis TaxID=750 RepID=UPI0022306CB0|nr:type ISP restriction/modification enzyme [Gallibacterium anatis]UZD16249.1 DEAD/DEAH box helicase family protein [Gallibacterium anatis]